MGFQIGGWARASVSCNEPIQSLSLLDSVTNNVIAVNSYIGSFRNYNYHSAVVTVTADVGAITGDALSAIAAPNYFNAVVADLQIGDRISVYSSFDGSNASFVVTNVGTLSSPNVVLQQLGGSSAVVSGSLTSAQIVAMYAAPVLIPQLAAPGAGYYYLINNFSLNLIYSTAALTGGGAVSLEYGSTAHAAGVLATGTIPAAVLTAGANAYGLAYGAALGNAASTVFANQGIYISNATAAFANGGGGLSTVNYAVSYQVLPIL